MNSGNNSTDRTNRSVRISEHGFWEYIHFALDPTDDAPAPTVNLGHWESFRESATAIILTTNASLVRVNRISIVVGLASLGLIGAFLYTYFNVENGLYAIAILFLWVSMTMGGSCFLDREKQQCHGTMVHELVRLSSQERRFTVTVHIGRKTSNWKCSKYRDVYLVFPSPDDETVASET
jgi:hypothetical protein